MGGVFAAVRFGNTLPADLRWLDSNMRLSALRDPRSIETITIWHRMYDEVLIPPDAISNDLAATLTVFQTGRTALMPLSWPSLATATEDPERSQVSGKAGYAPVPGGAPNASGSTFGIPVDAGDEFKRAAYLLITWLSNAENSRRQIAEFGNFFAALRRSVLTDDVIAQISERPNGASELAGLQALNSSWPNARFNPSIPEWPEIINAVSPILQQIVVGEMEPEVGMNAAADAGEAILAEAGYYN